MTTVNDRRFYVYAYLRTDGTPYYIGRGQRYRIHDVQNHIVKLPPKHRRKILATALTHEDANEWECDLIQLFGRKDLGTGCLRNLTDGGNEGNTGWVPSAEYRQNKAEQMQQWHRENPGVNGAKISAAKLGHIQNDSTRAKISIALIDADVVSAYGLTVDQWSQLDHAARKRVIRQHGAGVTVCADATLKELKAVSGKGVTVEQWRNLNSLQRKHFNRTKARADRAGVHYLTWVALTKSEQIKLALAA
jgi:hypothetical protein